MRNFKMNSDGNKLDNSYCHLCCALSSFYSNTLTVVKHRPSDKMSVVRNKTFCQKGGIIELIFNLKLKVLAKSETENKKVVRPSSSDPIVRGTGDIDYLCGTCEHVIAQSVNRWELERLTNAAFECYRCKSVNSLN